MIERERLLKGLPVDERRIDVNGVPTVVLEGGDGPLVLLHGGVECGGPYRLPIGLQMIAVRFALRPSEANMERFERWAFADLDSVRRRAPDWMDAFSTYTRSRARVPHVKRTMRYLVTTCTKQVHDHIDVPTTLVWGVKDRFVPLHLAEEASTRRGWPLQVVDDAGHVPHIERPAAFLEGVTRTRG